MPVTCSMLASTSIPNTNDAERNTRAGAGVVRIVTKNLLFVAPLLVTAALAVGCGDGGSSYGDTASSASTPAAAKTAAAVTEDKTAAASEVKMAGSTFAPGTIDLKVGDKVTFVNDDEIAHTATSDAFDSGTMDPGATFEFTAEEAGTISYVCSFHPGMTGTINVT